VTISEAARAVNKSIKTIRRWKNDGVNIFDESALREHSDFMDLRARGSAAKLAFDRPTTPAIGCPSFPGNSQQAAHALSILEGLKASFAKRLDKAKKIGDALEAGMLEEELRMLSESHRMLDAVCEAYLVG
jgi:hypothetical protein